VVSVSAEADALLPERFDALREVTVRLRELTSELGPDPTPVRAELRRRRALILCDLGLLDLAVLEYARCVLDDPDNVVFQAESAALRAGLPARP
jgi:hypothetical protein